MALSPELVYHAWEVGRGGRSPVVDILSATLTAVAFVREGAFPGTGNPLNAMVRQAVRQAREAAVLV